MPTNDIETFFRNMSVLESSPAGGPGGSMLDEYLRFAYVSAWFDEIAQSEDGDYLNNNAELKARLERRGCGLTLAEVDKLMFVYDYNRDGLIGEEELADMVYDGVLSTAPGPGGSVSYRSESVPQTRARQSLLRTGNNDGSLTSEELQSVLASRGVVLGMPGIVRLMALYDVNHNSMLESEELDAMFAESVLSWAPDGSLEYAQELVPQERILAAGVLPPSEDLLGSPAPIDDKPKFVDALRLLASDSGTRMMDMLEVREGSGIENGRFGTQGMWLLANLSENDSIWDSVAPELSAEERRALIDAARYALAPENATFLAEIHGGDGIFERGQLQDWIVQYETGEASDQEIDETNQQSDGNCASLSAINALASTPKGRELLEECITQNPDGSYTVTFPGDPTHPIIVTADEVALTDDGFSAGDADMNILEIALEKYAALNPQALGNDTIKEGLFGHLVFRLFTGDGEMATCEFDSARTLAWLELFAPLLERGELALTFDAKIGDEDFGNVPEGGWHAWAITEIDLAEGTITFTNPWDSGEPITMSLEEFSSKVRFFFYSELA